MTNFSESPETIKQAIVHHKDPGEHEHLVRAGHNGGLASAKARQRKLELEDDSKEQYLKDEQETINQRHGDPED